MLFHTRDHDGSGRAGRAGARRSSASSPRRPTPPTSTASPCATCPAASTSARRRSSTTTTSTRTRRPSCSSTSWRSRPGTGCSSCARPPRSPKLAGPSRTDERVPRPVSRTARSWPRAVSRLLRRAAASGRPCSATHAVPLKHRIDPVAMRPFLLVGRLSRRTGRCDPAGRGAVSFAGTGKRRAHHRSPAQQRRDPDHLARSGPALASRRTRWPPPSPVSAPEPPRSRQQPGGGDRGGGGRALPGLRGAAPSRCGGPAAARRRVERSAGRQPGGAAAGRGGTQVTNRLHRRRSRSTTR